MRDLIEPSELAAHLRRPHLDADPGIILACRLASGVVRETVEQTITLVEDDTYTLHLPINANRRMLTLPEHPVVVVTEVEVDGTVLDPAEYVVDDNGTIQLWPHSTKRLYGTVVVTYDHGHADTPEGVRAVTLAVAGRIFDNPTKETSRAAGGHTEGYTVDMTLDEVNILAKAMA